MMFHIKRLHNYVLINYDYAFLSLLPVLIFALQPAILGNRLGDVDTWFYFGHFSTLADYNDINSGISHNYYQTRLPYTIPGHLLFSIFKINIAKILFAYFVYLVTIFSLYYTLRSNISKGASLLGVTLLVSDIFFVRTFTWNYVDNGIIAYQALTFAALTAASRQDSYRIFWVFTASFLFTSMLFVHLGAAVLGLPIFGYAWLKLRLHQLRATDLFKIIGTAILGVIACQCLYGFLNVIIWGSPFLFALEQVAAGRNELIAMPQWRSIAELLKYGDWLAIHLAVCVASATALIFSFIGWVKLRPFHIYCFASSLVVYLLLAILDYNRLGVFLSRQGLYASFFLILSYMTVSCLVSQASSVGRIIVGASFLFSLALRIHFFEGGHLFKSLYFPTWMIGLSIGILLSASYLIQQRIIRILSLLLLSTPTLFINWKFDHSKSIYEAHEAIKAVAGQEIPRILADKNDPIYKKTIVSIIASFTERAWWLRGVDYPDLPSALLEKNKVFVLSSSLDSVTGAEALLRTRVNDLTPISFSRIQTPEGMLWISGFEVTRRMSLPAKLLRWDFPNSEIPASALPSLVGRIEGDARVGTEGTTRQGVLTFGPYARVAPGRYDITIQHGPGKGTHEWDVTLRDEDGRRSAAKGQLKPEESGEGKTVFSLEVSKPAVELEVRTHFSGFGHLEIRSISISPRLDLPLNAKN